MEVRGLEREREIKIERLVVMGEERVGERDCTGLGFRERERETLLLRGIEREKYGLGLGD